MKRENQRSVRRNRLVTVSGGLLALVVFASSMVLAGGTASALCDDPEDFAIIGEDCGYDGGGNPPAPAPQFDRVVALGDSFGAGTGYFTATRNYDDEECFSTDQSHAGQMADHLNVGFQNLACSGAATWRIDDQLDEATIPGTGAGTLITLTIGGNDVRAGDLGWGEVIGWCLVLPLCNTRVGFQPDNLDVVGDRVQNVYEDILTEFPDATLRVMAYPQLMQRSPGCPGVNGIGRGEADWVDMNAQVLNAILLLAVNAARAEVGGDIQLVEVADEFDDHGACRRFSWNRYIHDATPLFGNFIFGINKAFHPTKRGYDALFRVLRDSI